MLCSLSWDSSTCERDVQSCEEVRRYVNLMEATERQDRGAELGWRSSEGNSSWYGAGKIGNGGGALTLLSLLWSARRDISSHWIQGVPSDIGSSSRSAPPSIGF